MKRLALSKSGSPGLKKKIFRSGFVAVTGRPNVGKSTLVNCLVGHKVSITSPKSQTTRQRVLGVKTTEHSQMIFVDTPGLVSPRHLLGKTMVQHSVDAIAECDVGLFIVSVTEAEPTQEDRWAWRALRNGMKNRRPATPVFLILNKVDLIADKRALLPMIERYSELGLFADVFPVSALKEQNLKPLEEAMTATLPEGPVLFPEEDENSDESFKITEIIREKALFLLQEEVPHGIAVFVEEKRPGKGDKGIYLRATIYVERESHKAIVVGAGGKMLKRIGTLARKELSLWLKEPVFLDLWVKVKEGWQDRVEMLRMLGYS